ncbi:MAG TPA: N-acetylmuramoyl-L-alanine amidase [Bacteroidales bacterium]|nr:N-acetylmuramoyl-L-alanine amidase [Bacteroidales bacterium]
MDTVSKNGKIREIITGWRVRYFLLFSILVIPIPATEQPAKEQFVVVIDAGHGGHDPGAIGSSSKEKDIVLAIALKTGSYIKQNFSDVKVLYTRDKDIHLGLDKRAEIANKSGADLFISIHANAVPKGVTRNVVGSETYVLGTDKESQNLSVVMKENEVILLEEDYNTKYSGYDPKSPESFIVFSLIQNIHLKQSLELASLIQNQFKDRVGRVDRGVKQGAFLVLVMTTMPSVLVEAGFITNPAEEKFLKSEQGQDYIASAIFRAFRDYKANIDKKSSFTTVREAAAAATSQEPVTTDEETTFFTVQIATTSDKKELKPLNFKDLEQLSEFRQDDRYRYTSGKFRTYQEAVDYRKKISDKFPDAFVIAFKGTNIVPLQKAIETTTRK